MFVKLCGLKTAEDAQAAIDAGASAMGFILAESKRQVSPERVSSIRDTIINPPTIVGVTVNLTAEEILSVYSSARLDMVQLSGDEPLDILQQIDLPVIKVLRFTNDSTIDDATREVDAWLSHAHAPEFVIVEGHNPGSHGGTGTRANWKLVHEISVRYPIVLAGGLTPDNVGEAIARVEPIGVDTSSGIEIDGANDPALMTAFVANARSAFDRMY